MAIQINPPPFLRLPKAFREDREVTAFVEQQNIILFQLWRRTGGNVDLIGESSDETVIARALSVRNSQLFNMQSQINNASDRIEDNEIDLATRPRMSDIYRANQRIDELIDELIVAVNNLANTDLDNKSLALQEKVIAEIELMNARIEEAFDTGLEMEDTQ